MPKGAGARGVEIEGAQPIQVERAFVRLHQGDRLKHSQGRGVLVHCDRGRAVAWCAGWPKTRPTLTTSIAAARAGKPKAEAAQAEAKQLGYLLGRKTPLR